MEQRRNAGRAYVVTPTTGSGPGVLLLHSWWGLTLQVKDQADELADGGFVVVAPDLLGGELPTTLEEAEAIQNAQEVNEVAALVLSAVATLHGLPATTSAKIGVIGFSMGGSWGLWASARCPELVAAVTAYYGVTDVDFEPSQAEYQFHFAAVDQFVSEDDATYIEASLHLCQKPLEVFDYPGTAHWFAEPGTPTFDQAAASLAAERTASFMRERLKRETE